MDSQDTVVEIIQRNHRANEYLMRKEAARKKRDIWTLISGLIIFCIVYGLMLIMN